MSKLILLTGATGFLGPHVLNLLIKSGYRVCVVGPEPVEESELISWKRVNFLDDVDYDSLLNGVSIVVHLAAELYIERDMERINVEASKRLAVAAERNGVELFIYTSSVGVYGFPVEQIVSENTAVLSLNPSVKNIFLAENFLYKYSLSKLKGEEVIRNALKHTRAIFYRPSNIVDEEKIKEFLKWGLLKRIWRGARKTHHIYVKDVAEAILFAVDGIPGIKNLESNQVAIFNLSNDTDSTKIYANLHNLYAQITGDFSKSCPLKAPLFLDFVKDAIKFRTISGALPAGSVYYSPEKLINSGYRYRYGIEEIYKKVFNEMKSDL